MFPLQPCTQGLSYAVVGSIISLQFRSRTLNEDRKLCYPFITSRILQSPLTRLQTQSFSVDQDHDTAANGATRQW